MTGFDDIVGRAATEGRKAEGLLSRLWARMPAPPPKVEVAVAAHRSTLGTALRCAAALALAFGAYRLGGAEGRAAYLSEHAAFESYKAGDAKALADAKQHDIDATAAISAAVRKTQDAADLKSAYLQTKVDAYAADLARRPADARCSLSPDDLRSLRDDRGARPRRRPLHAPDAAE